MTYCSQCGRESEEDGRYCTKCGAPLVVPTLPKPTYTMSKDGSVLTGRIGDLHVLCFKASNDRRKRSQYKLLTEDESLPKGDIWTAIVWDSALRDPWLLDRQEGREKRGMALARQLIADATDLPQEEIVTSRHSGYVIPWMAPKMSCPHCGEDVDEGSKFCIHCGRLLSELPEKPLEQQTPVELAVQEPTN